MAIKYSGDTERGNRIGVGINGTGALTVDNGSDFLGREVFGGSTGTISVLGASVGAAGVGSFIARNGAKVNVTGEEAFIVVAYGADDGSNVARSSMRILTGADVSLSAIGARIGCGLTVGRVGDLRSPSAAGRTRRGRSSKRAAARLSSPATIHPSSYRSPPNR